ncbi:MAG TPA: thiamine pyrophosphate-dependent enzyme [Candidatus Thermoplasmatota archaeon]|nr:thiamine pyrophosphate-dependent enzyme [Candidatus Thermoplasmatota archaeon]
MRRVEERPPILREDGSVDKAREPRLPDATLLGMYRAMRLVRVLDERCMNLQRQGRIGFYGTSTGEEAAVVGSAAAVRPTDWIFPALRQGGALLYRGFPLRLFFNHMFGNAGSVELGRSMPMHFSNREQRFVTWSSSMATQLPHAVGMAYAARVKRSDEVAVAYMGDGATSEGDFHHALNFAGVWKAPVVFFCNNNQWAISVPFRKQTASDGVAVKAVAYGFPGIRLDGNDVLGVYAATHEAAERARRGEGPTLVEAVTYRMQGHSSSDDPTRYRSAEEVATWAKRDPIARFAAYLRARGVWSDAKEEALVAELNEEISQAIRDAEATAAPPTDTLVTEVYADVPWHLRREFAELNESLGR